MREIRFRAWDKRENTMRDVAVLHFTKGGKVNSIEYWKTPSELKSYHVRNLVLMQYTGLKDKHGVEIYEGDVLFHPLQGRRKVFYPYSETVASYGLRNIDNGFGSTLQDSHAVWEVIGNVYQNNDLLEVEE